MVAEGETGTRVRVEVVEQIMQHLQTDIAEMRADMHGAIRELRDGIREAMATVAETNRDTNERLALGAQRFALLEIRIETLEAAAARRESAHREIVLAVAKWLAPWLIVGLCLIVYSAITAAASDHRQSVHPDAQPAVPSEP